MVVGKSDNSYLGVVTIGDKALNIYLYGLDERLKMHSNPIIQLYPALMCPFIALKARYGYFCILVAILEAILDLSKCSRVDEGHPVFSD